jgi:hypothetical protein
MRKTILLHQALEFMKTRESNLRVAQNIKKNATKNA